MLEIQDSNISPGLDILRSFNRQLDYLLKTEINGHPPGLRDILKDYEEKLSNLLEVNDDRSVLMLIGILRHHSIKLEKLKMPLYELDLTAFDLDPVECEQYGTTQAEVGSRVECHEDGTFTTRYVSYISCDLGRYSARELLNIFEKYQLEAIGKIKEILIQRTKEKYNLMFETREERIAREEAEMGCNMAEHHARMEDLHEHLYDRIDGSVV